MRREQPTTKVGCLGEDGQEAESKPGAPWIDGMTVEETLPYLKEHKEELLS